MPENPSPINRPVASSWLFKMAWRDSRRNKARLFLFISAIVLGIAALVAVYSFKDNLQRDIDNQAKILTGADLIIEGRKLPAKKTMILLDTLGIERATERNFVSMVYFTKNQGSRLVQIRALQGNYPFYGEIETTPASAAQSFRQGQRTALVDKTLMLQFNVKRGDSIKVGELSFSVEGAIDKAPGQTGISSTVTPIVYIPLQYLEQTGLTQKGSRIQYKYYFRYSSASAVEKTIKQLQPLLEKENLDTETVASKKEDTGRSFKDVNRFLALSGFIALLLGCIGVGSAVHVYIREKLSSIATLRCLGVKSAEAFLIYLIQIVAIGFIGAVIGSLLGTLIQFLLPMVLKDFIPVEITMQVSWRAIGQGILLGLIISALFALPSLLAVRHISPLNALRLSFEKAGEAFDPLKWLVYLLILLFVLGFTWMQMSSWIQALVFTGGILIAFALLFALSKLLMWLVRRLLPGSASYLWRQGFANLYRPNNQTLMLTVSIGLSTAFICTLFFVQGILMNRVTLSSGSNQANMVLFDIQSEQKEAMAALVKSQKLPVMSQVPIVTVRIEEINGKTANELAKADSIDNREARGSKQQEPSQRAFKGELRVTWQDSLTSAEKIAAGKWAGKVAADQIVYVSLEENYARRIHVDVGDKIVFNVQGMLVPTVVGSLREVNWSRMQTNFRVVFPAGVLEDAPKFYVLMTRVPSGKASAAFQTTVVRNFPNVSVIDLELVLKILDELLSKIGFVIRFMAIFSMATGWVVLLSAVLTSKGQRLRESILLRTLGASRRQILVITALEYLFLGAVAAAAGMILALGGSWALARFSFATSFTPALWPVAAFFITIVLLVVITGVWSSRNVLNHPPLEVLRKDT
ncbi:putative ABC transport system permease protein [Pedobacter africanus]|uniref:ABC transport system permease protein n=1 Tax=Pedobacter africanus TaxID=151894 RepID=A0ACC6KUZ0_9SPHI|nr:FtsX-like permease family protein [Pedobacter africanus]MDR6782913.1 putative ABC transport system permease protein [Pedobacter africanus]